MLISELASKVNGIYVSGDCSAELSVESPVSDSRKAGELPCSIFIAVKGDTVDGHEFVDAAFKNGAVAALVSSEEALQGRPGIVVDDTRIAGGKLASILFEDPSNHLTVVGITGTNGKTTVHWLLYHLFETLGHSVARVGTLGFAGPGGAGQIGFTTPDAVSVHRLLRDFHDSGVSHVVMEVSSHALSQGRVAGVSFDVGVFTNLSPEHLDYHADMQDYLDAKWKLFQMISACGGKAAVVNAASEEGRIFIDRSGEMNLDCFDFGSRDENRVCIKAFSSTFEGSRLSLQVEDAQYQIESSFIGRFNAENLAAAFSVALSLGESPREIASALQKCPPVPGRLEPVRVSDDQDIGVFVDYAHTPDALVNVLDALRPLTRGKLCVVFGCGGDRDREKRPLMRTAVAGRADRVIVTSDNPRSEDPRSIIDEIVEGVTPLERQKIQIESDRKAAIELAILEASAGDIVLIAGKGHEDYQILGKEKIHFSDVEVARNVLLARYRC